MIIKRVLRDLARRFGYEITPCETSPTGRDAHTDMRRLVGHDRPVIFDVGANIGQSVEAFTQTFPACRMVSFEPCATTFETLKKNVAGMKNVTPVPLGLGRKKEQRSFREYSLSQMNSFLPPGKDAAAYGELERESVAEMSTVDAYCEEHGIPFIDVLKSDAQGLDLEVLEGASGMFRQHRIHLVYLEVIFADIYQKQATVIELLQFMEKTGLRLVSFYRFTYLNGQASWTDALFVDPVFVEKEQPPASKRLPS